MSIGEILVVIALIFTVSVAIKAFIDGFPF